MTPGLQRLTAELDRVVDSPLDERLVAARAGRLLASVLNDVSLLEPRHCEPADDRYRQHIVHVHPEGKYSVVALVWRPGQATPIHEHSCWCVVGVWQGLERERTYDLQSGPGGLTLTPRAVAFAGPGDVSVLVPPDEDIHLVENAGAGIAISVHVYGADIAERGTSINRTFPAELVGPERAVGDEPVSWRRLAA
jgi:predicted metal-dependent enzyme (double-stranded beta helix superfamily)